MSWEDDIYNPNQSDLDAAAAEAAAVAIETEIPAQQVESIETVQHEELTVANDQENFVESAQNVYEAPSFEYIDQNVHSVSNREGNGTAFSIEGGALVSIRHVVDDSATVKSDDENNGWSEQITNTATNTFEDDGYAIIDASRNGTLDELIVIDQNPENKLGRGGLTVAEQGAPLNEGDSATIYHNRNGQTEAISATVTDAGRGLIVIDLQGERQGDHLAGASGSPLVINGEVRGVVVASQINHETGSTQIVAIAIGKDASGLTRVDYSQTVGNVESELYADELVQISQMTADGESPGGASDYGPSGNFDYTVLNNYKEDPKNPELKKALEAELDTTFFASKGFDLVKGTRLANSNDGIVGDQAEIPFYPSMKSNGNEINAGMNKETREHLNFVGQFQSNPPVEKVSVTIKSVGKGLIVAEVDRDLSSEKPVFKIDSASKTTSIENAANDESVGDIKTRMMLDKLNTPLIINGKVHGYIVDIKEGEKPETTQLIAVAVVDDGTGKIKFDSTADDGKSKIEPPGGKDPELLFIEKFHNPPMTEAYANHLAMSEAAATDAQAAVSDRFYAGELAKNDPTMKWFTIDGTSMTSVEAGRLYSREVFGSEKPTEESTKDKDKDKDNSIEAEMQALKESITTKLNNEIENGDIGRQVINDLQSPQFNFGSQPSGIRSSAGVTNTNTTVSQLSTQQKQVTIAPIEVTARQQIESLEPIEEIVVTTQDYDRDNDGSLSFTGGIQYAADEASYQFRHRGQDALQGVQDIGNGISTAVDAIAAGTADEAVVDAVKGIADLVSNYDNLSPEVQKKIDLALVELGIGVTGVGGVALDGNTILTGQNFDGSKASPADIAIAVASLALTAVGAQQIKAIIKAAGTISDIAHDLKAIDNAVNGASDAARVVSNGPNASTVVGRTDNVTTNLPANDNAVNDNFPIKNQNQATGTHGSAHTPTNSAGTVVNNLDVDVITVTTTRVTGQGVGAPTNNVTQFPISNNSTHVPTTSPQPNLDLNQLTIHNPNKFEGGYVHETNPNIKRNLPEIRENLGVNTSNVDDAYKNVDANWLNRTDNSSPIENWADEDIARFANDMNMSPDDLKLIYNYTETGEIGTTGMRFIELNQSLRAGANLSDMPIEVQRLAEAVEKMPSFQGQVFRGTVMSLDDLNNIKPGGTITSNSFTSTTTNFNEVTQYLARGSDEIQDGVSVVYSIESKTGHVLGNVSRFPSEGEVLFAPGANFSVASVESKAGVAIVKLVEDVPVNSLDEALEPLSAVNGRNYVDYGDDIQIKDVLFPDQSGISRSTGNLSNSTFTPANPKPEINNPFADTQQLAGKKIEITIRDLDDPDKLSYHQTVEVKVVSAKDGEISFVNSAGQAGTMRADYVEIKEIKLVQEQLSISGSGNVELSVETIAQKVDVGSSIKVDVKGTAQAVEGTYKGNITREVVEGGQSYQKTYAVIETKQFNGGEVQLRAIDDSNLVGISVQPSEQTLFKAGENLSANNGRANIDYDGTDSVATSLKSQSVTEQVDFDGQALLQVTESSNPALNTSLKLLQEYNPNAKLIIDEQGLVTKGAFVEGDNLVVGSKVLKGLSDGDISPIAHEINHLEVNAQIANGTVDHPFISTFSKTRGELPGQAKNDLYSNYMRVDESLSYELQANVGIEHFGEQVGKLEINGHLDAGAMSADLSKDFKLAQKPIQQGLDMNNSIIQSAQEMKGFLQDVKIGQATPDGARLVNSSGETVGRVGSFLDEGTGKQNLVIIQEASTQRIDIPLPDVVGATKIDPQDLLSRASKHLDELEESAQGQVAYFQQQQKQLNELKDRADITLAKEVDDAANPASKIQLNLVQGDGATDLGHLDIRVGDKVYTTAAPDIVKQYQETGDGASYVRSAMEERYKELGRETYTIELEATPQQQEKIAQFFADAKNVGKYDVFDQNCVTTTVKALTDAGVLNTDIMPANLPYAQFQNIQEAVNGGGVPGRIISAYDETPVVVKLAAGYVVGMTVLASVSLGAFDSEAS